MYMKKLFFISLTVGLFFVGCTCQEYIALADLLSTSGIVAPQGTIKAGKSYDFSLEAINKGADTDSKECSSTATSKATEFYVNVLLKGVSVVLSASGSKPMPAINANATANLINSIIFPDSGTYVLEYFLDYPDYVKERNEQNQKYNWPGKMPNNVEARLAVMRKTNNYYSLTVKVEP